MGSSRLPSVEPRTRRRSSSIARGRPCVARYADRVLARAGLPAECRAYRDDLLALSARRSCPTRLRSIA